MLTDAAKKRLEKDLAGVSNHPVAVAVRPLRESATDAAERYARGVVATVQQELEAAGNDRNVAAPYPNSNIGRNEYVSKVNRYHLFHRLTTARPDQGYMPNRQDFADMNPEAIEKFVTEMQEMAGFNYDAFVIKLVKKIGAVAKATITQQDVWAHSILTITRADGSVELWKTQQIINTSSRGLMFNQWPTRKLKSNSPENA